MRLCLALGFLGLSACTTLDRSAHSGYGFEESESAAVTNIYHQRRMNVESEAREELGLLGRVLEENERQAVELRIQLKRKENNLATKREKQQYYSVRSHLRNDRERLHFLTLPTFEARDRWARARGLGSEDGTYPDEIANLIEGNDIAIGMSQKAVMESWGDPDAVETAGDPLYGYERWKYNRYVSGNEGYQKELRIVYFEGGRVVGWERL